jgi:hypothetical protein
MKAPGPRDPVQPTLDRFAAARAIADAVLYEGYVLYPYRASARKNQLRWQFGVLVPRAFSEAEGSERWFMRTECLVMPGADPVVPEAGPQVAQAGPAITVRVRCLQVQHRSIEASTGAGAFVPVDQLDVDGRRYVSWDEAIDRVAEFPPWPLEALQRADHEEVFGWSGGAEVELVRGPGGAVAGRVVRQREPVKGRVRVSAVTPVPGEPWARVAVTVENTGDWAGTGGWTGTGARRDEVMGRSLVAVHTMLAVDRGRFLSLVDPPDQVRPAVESCHNDGTFPVLIGNDDLVLSSPIILYDHPEVAPESPGDLYDATEIDEILALRVLTLTDEEKSEARGTDPRAAAIIDRCDDMPPEMWERLHGAVRSLHPAEAGDAIPPFADDDVPVYVGEGALVDPGAAVPWWDPGVDASVDPWSDSVMVGGVLVSKGTPVRLRPSHRADAQDLFLAGLSATVAGVFKDVDGSEHVAVTVDDDPATAELAWQGRYLFFHPDEVEPLSAPGVTG